MIGRTIGGYRIESLLGQGGMGSVYRGTDLMLDRPVAVKALRADVAASPDHVERFRQEAKTLARLLDPHIATLYAMLREGDDLYMVMEFVEGETFEALLARERWLPVDRALDLFGQALKGLDHAHRRGIIHRDVKPANFMLTPGGTVKVMDFGIARLLGSARMTQTRHAIGTAEYMAPEQVRAREVDARTDVYALGVLLYEMLTGRVPFEAESAFEVMQAHLQTPPPSPRRLVRDLPDGVVEAVVRALAKDPADRFPSIEAFRAALRGERGMGNGKMAEGAASRVPMGSGFGVRGSSDAASRTDASSKGDPDKSQDLPGVISAKAETHAAQPSASTDLGTSASDPEGARAPAPPTVVAASRTRPDRSPETGVDTSAPPPSAAASTDTPAVVPAQAGTQGDDLEGDRSLDDSWNTPPVSQSRPHRQRGQAAHLRVDDGADAASSTDATRPVTETAQPSGQSAPPTVIASRPDLKGAPPILEATRRVPPPTVAATLAPAEPEPQRAAQRAVAIVAGLALLVAVGLFTMQQPDAPVLEVGPTDIAASEAPSRSSQGPTPSPLPPPPPAVSSPEIEPGGTEPEIVVPTDRGTQEPPPTQPEPQPVRPAPSRPAPERVAQVPTPSPEPQTGTARILVRPFGDVYLDGRRLASGTNAPVTADLEAGTYTVRATHPTFGELTETVRVRAGRTAEVRLEFATPAEVTVTSDVLNAEILIDGRRTGRYTPAVVTVPPGTHTITAERDGQTSRPRTVTVAVGQRPGPVRLTF